MNAQAVSIAYSPDGNNLVSEGWDGTQIWDAATGELQNELKDGGSAIAFLPDGKTLLSCSGRTVRLSQSLLAKSERPKDRRIGAHLDSVVCVAVSRDGKMLASGANDGSIKLWSTPAMQGQLSPKTATEFTTWADEPSPDDLQSVLPLPDGKRVLAVTSRGTEMRDLASGQRVAAWSGAVGRGAISPDGKLLATGTVDGKVKLWDVASGRLLASVQAHPGGESALCVAVAFSPDGRVLVTGGSNLNEPIKFWDPAASLKLIRQVPTPPSAGISALGFSPDGKMLAAALIGQRVLLMNRNGQAQRLISMGGGYILASVFSPDSKLLATARESGVISLWEAQTGRLHFTLKGHTSAVRALAFSPDGSFLASGSGDHTVRLWDVATGQERIAFKGNPSVSVTSVAFSPDGSTLIAGHSNGVVSLRRGNRTPEADVEVQLVDETGKIETSAQDYNAMAWTLATDPDPEMRDGQRAMDFAEKAAGATNHKDPVIMDTLAAAYAELGQFTNAARYEQGAIALLQDSQLKNDCTSRLKLYESNLPYRSRPQREQR
jgi:WD40 repeat protein